MNPRELDLSRLKVRPLDERESLAEVDDVLVSPDAPLPALPAAQQAAVELCAQNIRAAREADASVILIYGAHLLRNGAAPIIERLLDNRWITHLATNGAGTIHDWEFAWLGRSTENVERGVAAGNFGAWDETGRNIMLALLVGGLRGEGYGEALGRFICEDGVDLPNLADLAASIQLAPAAPLTPARAEMLRVSREHRLRPGHHKVVHRWKHASILATAWRLGVPVTAHPGIGYDIVACHPMFDGAAIGRAAEIDFRIFSKAVEKLDGGVVLSIGSAIMGPQIFEKSLSCVHNLRFQEGRGPVSGHAIHVVDLQDGEGWDWSAGEPPKTHPAYYLRFCKSYSRMGGAMHYAQCDNLRFIHALGQALGRAPEKTESLAP